MYKYLPRTLSRLLLLSFLLACGACRFFFPSTSPGGSKIDKKVWGRYFGDVGEEPTLPANIAEIMESDCPFWPGRKVQDTHLLVLIPSHVGGEALTLDSLGELIKSPRGGGHKTQYRYYSYRVCEEIGNQATDSSYWVLMTRDVLPESRNKSYGDQCQLMARHQGYTVPGALEAAVVMLLHHVRSGEHLYSDNPWTYTRCRDRGKYGDSVIVGGFSSEGLFVRNSLDFSLSHYGVAALRKLDIGHWAIGA